MATKSKKSRLALSKELRALMTELGRRGGKKSAAARMEKIPPKQRSEIARNAVKARWEKWNREHGKQE
jgi:hypothetical protein